MSLHLHTKSFEAPLGDRGKDDLWREKKDLLDDPAKCAELIAGYQAGPGEPWFATERADVAGMEAKLGAAQGKEHVVVVGNGGSIRNVWALYLAFFERGFSRKLHLLDGTDMSGLFGELLRADGAFNPENTLVVPVSKSGNTENVIQETALLMERGYPALAITSSGPEQAGRDGRRSESRHLSAPRSSGWSLHRRAEQRAPALGHARRRYGAGR